MSLKNFHFVFIAAAAALSFLCGFWLIQDFRNQGGTSLLVLGCAAFASGIGLIAYEWAIYKKLNWIDMI
jgi:hypothetical protein